MATRISAVTLVAPDYDEAIAFFTGALGFELVEDVDLGGGKRWVLVAPGGGGVRLLIARAADDRQRAAIGAQTGGRVFLFLETDDINRDRRRFEAAGVRFLEPIREEAYGRVAVFLDAFGNKWDLIERRQSEG